MSEDEKTAQVGEAVLLLEKQKREMAHLTEKIEKVRTAYSTYAGHVSRWRVDPARPGKVFLENTLVGERDLSMYLLSESQLAELVSERQKAGGSPERDQGEACEFRCHDSMKDTPDILNRIVDKVLAYRPKPKSKAGRKRKRLKAAKEKETKPT